MIADLHIHSKYSYDSILSPYTILKAAKKKGLTCIAVTDHNTITGGIETKKNNADDDFQVIVGSEIRTEIGDIIGLFLNNEIKSRYFFEVIDEIQQQGGIIILPHPFRAHKLNDTIVRNVDAIEIFNGRSSLEENHQAMLLARQFNKVCVAGSDAHFASEIGSFRMKVNSDYLSNKDNIQKLENCEFSGHQSPPCYVDASQMVKSLKKREYFEGIHYMASLLYHTIKEGL